MYNRYIPQEDGTFQKKRYTEPDTDYVEEEALPPPRFQKSEPYGKNSGGQEIGSFFRNLLPEHLDTEDLIVILLLLLISGNQGEDGDQALLTLGAYLFL